MSLPEGEATAIVRATGCGVCVPPEDPAAMSQALLHFLDNPQALAKAKRSSADAAADHSRQTQAMLMLEILEKTVDNSTRRAGLTRARGS